MRKAANADRFEELPPEQVERWSNFPILPGHGDAVYLPRYLGIQFEEVRHDYARMRLPFRKELCQPAGVFHGGAIASLIDTCVVPAIGSAYPQRHMLFTIDMHVSYLDAIGDEDAVAEGWVEKRGASIVYCRVEVRGAGSEKLGAAASLVYKVSSRPLPDARATKPMLG